jgi:hypothetical protein
MSEVRTDSLVNQSGDNDSGIDLSTNDVVAIKTANSEALRVDSSGNLLVGKTSTGYNSGTEINYEDFIRVNRTNGSALYVGRNSGSGELVSFREDGTDVGSIGTTGGDFYITKSGTNQTGIYFNELGMLPMTSGSISDDSRDIGQASYRWDDIYATNGTIQTSDQNEKQQIASLTDAEITAAKAISQLFKTFKWNSSVTERGDAARTHTGVIAQDVEAAMTAAGLDAGDYAFFISTDWYVDADGNEVEADAEGAIAKNRKGIRYPELLSFVGAATEQRLANIETRLAALENA